MSGVQTRFILAKEFEVVAAAAASVVVTVPVALVADVVVAIVVLMMEQDGSRAGTKETEDEMKWDDRRSIWGRSGREGRRGI